MFSLYVRKGDIALGDALEIFAGAEALLRNKEYEVNTCKKNVPGQSVPQYTFPGRTVRCMSFARQTGISLPPFDSLNVSLHVGDDPARVRENRKRVKKSLGLDFLVSARQVHGDRVLAVEARPGRDIEVDGCDAFITNIPGIGLMVQQADCQAVMLYDPVKKVVGNIHSGWRGSVRNIIGKVVGAMQETYGAKPADLHAAISPSLGPCCAEFVHYQREMPPELHQYQARPDYFDFWAISRDQLCAAGLKKENISIAGICTKCDPDYFSYRRDGVTGRCASVIALR